MSEEQLTDEDPFDDDAPADDENLITDAMVRKATYLIHKLADQKGQDYKDIQKKCKKLFAYTNLAKVDRDQGHQIINKLIELTGGEEEKPQLPRKPEDGFGRSAVNAEPRQEEEEPKHEEKETVQEDDFVIRTMRESIRAAVSITLGEIVSKEVPVMGLGGVVLEVGKVIFEAKMKKEEAV